LRARRGVRFRVSSGGSVKVATGEQPPREEGVIRVHVAFPEDELRLHDAPVGFRVELADCHSNAGQPGEPALPRTTIHVALPEGAWPTKLGVGDEHSIRLTDEPTLVVPVQPLRPGVTDLHKRPDDDEDEHVVEPYPAPPFVPPDPELYERAAR